MNWLTRNWKPTAAASVLIAGAITAGVLWPSSPDQDHDPSRPILARLDQTSVTYLNRHAQPWLSAPTAASTTYAWKFSEAASPLVDYLSGTSAQLAAAGTPVYQVHTPIPTTTGFDRRATAFNGSSAYFDAAVAAVGDVGTNNFTIKGWLCPQSVTSGYIASKINGGNGWDLYFNAGALTLRLTDAGGSTAGSVGTWPVVSATNLVGCQNYQVRVDRAGNATADFGGVNSGVNLNVAARNLTLTNAVNLRVGRSAAGGATYYTGTIGELVIANGLGTLAEQVAEYKAFKVPTSSSPGVVGTPTYTQTTTRKWPLPPEGGFGERLGVYAGSATNPQWPVGYDATKVNAVKGNGLGLGFPESGATTNVLGDTNDCTTANWFKVGTPPTCAAGTANTIEAPDGSMTADVVVLPANSDYIRKQAVGAGALPAGGRACNSLYIKQLSGTCTAIDLYDFGGNPGSFCRISPITMNWARYSCCLTNVTWSQGMLIRGTTVANCTIAIADMQSELNNVTPPCTSTTGNVSQTCNASFYTLTIPSNKMTLLPAGLERFEIVHNGWSVPYTSAPGTPQVKWIYGNKSAYLAEGVNTALVLNNQGGGPEYVAKYRGLGSAAESRDYVASWDLRNGLTNTSPRRYGGLSTARSGAAAVYSPFNLESRKVDATIDAATPPQQLDLNSNVVHVGCDNTSGTPTNCAQGGVDLFEVWGRPAQDIKATDSTSILNADFTGASYVQAQAIPRFTVPSGASSANTWIWDMGEYSGSLYDRINAVALAPTGTPRYQAWSGLLGRGQGRRGIFENPANNVRASASILSIGAKTAWTIEVLANRPASSGDSQIVDTTANNTTTGYAMILRNGYLDCVLRDDAGNNMIRRSGGTAATIGYQHYFVCTWSYSGGRWNGVAYVDTVEPAGSDVGVVATSTVASGGALAIHETTLGTTSIIYEVAISDRVRSAADILSRYRQTIQQGTYWADDANTLAHYKMNETTLANGVGLRDHSGNGNHLTVVTGTPTPQYADMPWPAGSGTYKPAVEYAAAGNYHSGGAAAAVPSNAQSFSFCPGWIKYYQAPAADQVIVAKGTANDYYDFTIRTTGRPRFRFSTNEGGLASTETATSIADNTWHYLCAKAVYAGGTYTPYISIDGGAFTYVAGSTTTGDPSGNAANIVIGTGLAASPYQISGTAFFKDKELIDAEVLAMASPNGTTPVTGLTYSRTNKSCYEVGNHPIDGIQVRCWGANQVPFGWDSSVPTGMGNDRTGWGIPRHDAVTNMGYYSEILDSWASAQITITPNNAVAPDGSTTAERLTETAVNAVHYANQNYPAITIAQNNYATWRGFYRRGTNQWQYHYVAIVGSTAYCNVDTLNATTGLVGTSAAGFANVTCSVLGVGNGWVEATLTFMCNTVGGCTIPYTGTIMSNGNMAAYPSYLGSITNYNYAWGFTFTSGSTAVASQAYGVYCPSPSNSATTCNASSAYIPTANLVSWNRAQGQVGSLVFSRNASGYGWDMSNGVNNNNRIYELSQGTEHYLYNSAGVLQQRVSLANAQISIPTGVITQWDNTSDFYVDPTGTGRQLYSRTMQSTYAGPHPTYTTDTAAAWVTGTDTNWYIGADNTGANSINGLIINQSVHSTR